MTKDDFNDGICNECGEMGLAGEKCRNCGGILSKIDADLSDPLLSSDDDLGGKQVREPEVYPLEEVDKEADENI